jgi:CubicO group peptidase (beta-lactamase class C family)
MRPGNRIFIFLFVLWSYANGQTKSEKLDQYFSAAYKNGQFNGNVLVAENGGIVYEHSFGYADLAEKRPNTSESVFPVASITKTFTATAILQLKEKGMLTLNDPVEKYLPTFPYSTITILNLLSHTSGLPRYDDVFESLRTENRDTVFTDKDILPRYALLKLPLMYEPGTYGNYNNVNFIFLGLIVEKITGLSIHEYVQKNILVPANMTNTFFPKITIAHYTPEEKKNLSFTYSYAHYYSDKIQRSDSIKDESDYWHSYQFTGFGELVSSARDLYKFDLALYNGTLLSESTLREAFAPVRLKNEKVNPVGNGEGWRVDYTEFGKIVFHGGGLTGLRSIFLRNINKRQVIIIIDNMENPVEGMSEDALKILNGRSVNLPLKSVAKIYGLTIASKGIAVANTKLAALEKDSMNYKLDEDEFNELGYDFLRSNRQTEALEVFKTNMRLFPSSWNVYDSYGEALLKNGNKTEAIKMYKKSVEMNPGNENGKKILEQLEAKPLR